MGALKKRQGPAVGLAIDAGRLAMVAVDPKSLAILDCAIIPLEDEVFYGNETIVASPLALADAMALLKGDRKKLTGANVSLPSALVRCMEVPALKPAELIMSISSEAMRYRQFDNTDAVVDMTPLSGEEALTERGRVIFGAMRRDTYDVFGTILKQQKIKLGLVDFTPFCILRAIAAYGLLDDLVDRIGDEGGLWGYLLFTADRVHISVWQESNLIDWRELPFSFSQLQQLDFQDVQDLLDECTRTAKGQTINVWGVCGDLGPDLHQMLQSSLDVPVLMQAVPALVEAGAYEPIVHAALGAALAPTVPFPFHFNLKENVSGGGSGPSMEGSFTSIKAIEIVDDEKPQLVPNLMLVFSVLSVFLGLFVWGGLVAFNAFQMQPKLDEAKQTLVKANAQKSEAEDAINTLQQQYGEHLKLAEMMAGIAKSNRLAATFVDQLQAITPPKQLYVHNIVFNQQVQLNGKALSDFTILDFAKEFDRWPFLANMQLTSIQEELIRDKKVYRFQLIGQLFPGGLKDPPPQANPGDILPEADGGPSPQAQNAGATPAPKPSSRPEKPRPPKLGGRP